MRQSSLAVGKETPIERFYGVGEKRAQAFHKLGIFTAFDLIYHIPRAYEPRGYMKTTRTVENGDVCSLILTVGSEPKNAMIRRGMTITKFTAFDETDSVKITFFNQPYVKDMVHKGATFRFFGKVTREGFSVSMNSPVIEAFGGAVPLRDLVPVYPLTSGISQKLMQTTMRAALESIFAPGRESEDPLPHRLREQHSLMTLKDAMFAIHFPKTQEESEQALKRLAFDELYRFALSMMLYGGRKKEPFGMALPSPNREKFLARLPYRLTGAQCRAIEDIERDITGNTCMNRLVVGDVGSGKTIVAAYAIHAAIAGGMQAALMAPTEILARQHFGDLSAFFGEMGYRTKLLVGSMTAAAKRKVLQALAKGDADLVIGTHALIEEAVAFRRLGLAIVDEQHRFGARQRATLAAKGENGVHVLSMSATPIPRTLAAVLYCNIDVSLIDEMPPGRQKVDTFHVDERYRARLHAFVRKQVEMGGQVYIVCPAVEEEETLEGESGEALSTRDLLSLGLFREDREERPKLKAAVTYAGDLAENVFPEYRVAFVHGKLSGKEKDRIMREFAAGEIDILVSTTVIEVGVNVPRATLMIVENAENFGLSALHQLRGRVGRGNLKSYCVLVSDSKSKKAKQRLQILCENADGFVIAEKDLEMRGPGDFIAQLGGKTRQSGEFDLGIASLERDERLLYAAFEGAKQTLLQDPKLTSQENRHLAAALEEERARSSANGNGTI